MKITARLRSLRTALAPIAVSAALMAPAAAAQTKPAGDAPKKTVPTIPAASPSSPEQSNKAQSNKAQANTEQPAPAQAPEADAKADAVAPDAAEKPRGECPKKQCDKKQCPKKDCDKKQCDKKKQCPKKDCDKKQCDKKKKQCDKKKQCAKRRNPYGPGIRAWPIARLRTGYNGVFGSVNEDGSGNRSANGVGAASGFAVDQARIGVGAQLGDNVDLRMVFDAATALGQSDLQDMLLTGARDVFVHIDAVPGFEVWAGQLYMPGDAEGEMSRRILPFAQRSVSSRGMSANEGLPVAGLSTVRDVGVVLGARDLVLGDLGLEYRLGVSNGNGVNLSTNDNTLPALSGRLGLRFQDMFKIGVGGSYNPRTVGTLQNDFAETDTRVFGDVQANVAGVNMLASVLWQQRAFGSTGSAEEQSLGMAAWLVLDKPFGVDMFGLKPGYRFSYLDASSARNTDQIMEHSIAVRYDAPNNIPLAFFVQFDAVQDNAPALLGTATDGATAVDLNNNRLSAVLQVNLDP